jgi:hypothetical protein
MCTTVNSACAAQHSHNAGLEYCALTLGVDKLSPLCQLWLTLRSMQAYKALKMDVDIKMEAYLTREADGKEKNALFIVSHEQLAALEGMLQEFRRAEAAGTKAVASVSAQRDKAARHASMQARACPAVKRTRSGCATQHVCHEFASHYVLTLSKPIQGT